MRAMTEARVHGMSEGRRSVVITGAAQGLGRALARAFASDGYAVAACDVQAEALEQTVGDITAAGGAAIAIACDISDAAQCVRAVDQAQAAFGRIDVLNNAGLRALDRTPFWETTEATWDRFMAVNVRGSWLMTCAVRPHLLAAGGGSIIMISSAAVLEVPAMQAHYVTSKAALIGLTRATARELGAFGIRVNAILPSSLTTEVPKKVDDSEIVARRIAGKALARGQTPDDVVGVALFLASDAARYLTGQSLNVDGGGDFL